MALTYDKPRDRLLAKMIAPENFERIEQWLYWNAMVKRMPDQFKVQRLGLDFALLMKVGGCHWLPVAHSKPAYDKKLFLIPTEDD